MSNTLHPSAWLGVQDKRIHKEMLSKASLDKSNSYSTTLGSRLGVLAADDGGKAVKQIYVMLTAQSILELPMLSNLAIFYVVPKWWDSRYH